jgi:predicted Rossmann-fold nucleotide-binding protein
MKDLSKITFFADSRMHEDLRIRVHYDGFGTLSEFFRACVIAYLEKNPQFMSFLDCYKESEKMQSKANIKKSIQLRQQGKTLMKNLAITEEDVENIFDLIEKEIPDL